MILKWSVQLVERWESIKQRWRGSLHIVCSLWVKKTEVGLFPDKDLLLLSLQLEGGWKEMPRSCI